MLMIDVVDGPVVGKTEDPATALGVVVVDGCDDVPLLELDGAATCPEFVPPEFVAVLPEFDEA